MLGIASKLTGSSSTESPTQNTSSPSPEQGGSKAGSGLDTVQERATISDCVTERRLDSLLPPEWTANFDIMQLGDTDTRLVEAIKLEHERKAMKLFLIPDNLVDPTGATTIYRKPNSARGRTQINESKCLSDALAWVNNYTDESAAVESRFPA